MYFMRGLIVSGETTLDNSGKLTLPFPHIDFDMLKYWCLYWDKIDWPIDNIWRIGWRPEHPVEMYADLELVSDLAFLHHQGILDRSELKYHAEKNTADKTIAYDALIKAFRRHERKEPGAWFVSQDISEAASLAFPNRKVDTLRVNIVNAVPAPSADTPLVDVLEFKESHREELQEFFFHIDEIYQDILQAPDRPLAERSAHQRLEKAIENAVKIAEENNRITFRPANLTASFSLTTGTTAGVMTFLQTQSASSALMTAAIVGGSVSVSKGLGFDFKSNRSSPMEYITSFTSNNL